MRNLIFVFALFFLALPAKAKDLYIAQSSTRTSGGTNCSTALSVAWFNNKKSWGTGSTQIGPGTTVHLCGTFTGTNGQQLLTVHGSGTSSAPITIKFETNAKLVAPYWSPFGAIYIDGLHYIVVDGGTNGLIENTANGTTLANKQNSRGISAPGCDFCTVKNITVANLYVHTSTSDTRVSHDVNCVYMVNSNNFTITNLTCHDANWAVAGSGNNFSLSNSNIYNVDHGVAFGAAGLITNFSIHDNHIHDYTRWDTLSNYYHHDGVHVWGQNGGTVRGGAIYNNLFDGDPGVNITAHVFLQDSVQDVAVYNNVFIVPATRGINVLWFFASSTSLPGGSATGNSSYNNTMSAGDHRTGSGMFVQSQISFTAVNNVLMGGSSDISIQGGGTLSSTGINNNVYMDLDAAYKDTNTFGFQKSIYHTLATWQHACHCDAQSRMSTSIDVNLSSQGILQAGSPAIKAGANLLHLSTGLLTALKADKVATARPTTGAWDVGAYQNGAKITVAGPANVTATVQ